MNPDECNGCGGGPCHGDCKKFRTTQNKPTCCEKCRKIEYTGAIAGTIGSMAVQTCSCAICPCHTSKTTYTEEWLNRFSVRFPNWTDGNEAIKDFIRETAEAAYEKGVRDSLGVVEKLNVKSFDHLIKEDVVDFVRNIVSISKEELTKTISTLLK